jgi:hypothetical protein
MLIATFLACVAITATANALTPVTPRFTTESYDALRAELRSAGFPPNKTVIGDDWSSLERFLEATIGIDTKWGGNRSQYEPSYGWAVSGGASARVVDGCKEFKLIGWKTNEPSRVLRLNGTFCPTGSPGWWTAKTIRATVSTSPNGVSAVELLSFMDWV